MFLVHLQSYLAFHQKNAVAHLSPDTLNTYLNVKRERDTLAENQTPLEHFMMGGGVTVLHRPLAQAQPL